MAGMEVVCMDIDLSEDLQYYKESFVLGLTVKQAIFSFLALGVGTGIVLLLYKKIGITLALIRERGKLMAEVSTGSMAAIIGIYREKILEILKIYHLDNIDIANCNSYKQTVIAGPISDLQRAKEFFVAAGAKFIFLKVSGPFHSRYMRDAAMKFKPVIDEIYFEQPIIPVISNYLAEEYTRSKVGDNLINQIYNPVKWVETIEFLVKNNVMEFIQIGPGRTLNNLCKNILNHR